MSRYYHVWINGHGIQDIDPTLTVTGVEEKAPELELQTSANAKYDGTHVTGFFRRSLEVEVKLWCKERRMERRARLLDKIREWADDGVLRVNYRPHQQLQVIRTALPSFGGEWKWAEEISLGFTAYGVPFWQDDTLTRTQVNGTQISAGIRPPGTAERCFLRWSLTNRSGSSLTSLTVKNADNGTFITLSGISVAPGGMVAADYDLNGYLSIKDGNGNTLLPKRTAASYDDVVLNQRSGNTIEITASGEVDGVISARGLYL